MAPNLGQLAAWACYTQTQFSSRGASHPCSSPWPCTIACHSGRCRRGNMSHTSQESRTALQIGSSVLEISSKQDLWHSVILNLILTIHEITWSHYLTQEMQDRKPNSLTNNQMDIRGVCLGIRGRRRVCPKSQEPNNVGMALPRWTQPDFWREEILVKFLPCVEPDFSSVQARPF